MTDRPGRIACDSNRGLHSGAGGGPQAAGGRGVSFGMAGNRTADRGERHRAHAPGVRIAARGSGGSDRPGIGPCCYAVGDEVLSSFESQFTYFRDLFREVSDSDPVKMKYSHAVFLPRDLRGTRRSGPVCT